jgi:hypothetical protein
MKRRHGATTRKTDSNLERLASGQVQSATASTRRYVMIAVLFLGSIALLAEALIFGTNPLVLWIGLGLYLVASVYWAVVITRPGPRLPLRLVALWLPLLPCIGLLATTFAAIMRHGEDPLALVLWLPSFFVVALICLAGTVSALLRYNRI